MGEEYSVKCKRCGHEFIVRDGGGFFFHLLHCDTCGKEKSISFDELGESYVRFMKSIPYCVALMDNGEKIQKNYPEGAMDLPENASSVESVAGKCECGGEFTFDAPPRCPKCRSTDFERHGCHDILYD